MATLRINKTKDYTVMANHHLRNKELSLKAKGLMSVMLSLPDNWDYSIGGLVAICCEKENAITSALKELKKFGYLRVDKVLPDKSDNGRIEYVYNIFEVPQGNQGLENQGLENQGLENQGLENQGLENQGQLNTNISNNNILNTNNIYIVETQTKDVISYLNEKTGKKFTTAKCNAVHIQARLNDGYTVEDMKKVIDLKTQEWKGTQFDQYLRPKTLFRPSNFENYLNQRSETKNECRTNETNNDDFFDYDSFK